MRQSRQCVGSIGDGLLCLCGSHIEGIVDVILKSLHSLGASGKQRLLAKHATCRFSDREVCADIRLFDRIIARCGP